MNIDCGTYNKAGVDEVGRWFAAQMTAMGADVSIDHNAELGDTVVSVLEGEGGGDHALLIGHLDTVFDDGTAAERPFSMADGRAYGPGVNDMKAGLLTRPLRAAGAWQSTGSAAVRQVTYLANPDEEIGSPVPHAGHPSRRAEGVDVVLRARVGPCQRRHRQRAQGHRRFRRSDGRPRRARRRGTGEGPQRDPRARAQDRWP